MIKKFTLLFTILFATLFISSNSLFAQVKKTSTNTIVKKTTTSKALPVITGASIRVKITTDSGILIVKLYDSTPLHRDNFVKLVNEGFYDSLLFHRVIAGFMIQGGDPLSKNADASAMLGNGGGNMERIPAEFNKGLIHKKGALAAARDGNPQKASSACQFYLVDGKIYADDELNNIEMSKGIKYTAEQRSIYKTIGGTAFLDQDYTVFGEVESGMQVISKIANAQKNDMNRPTGDIRMHIELVK